MEKFKTGNVVRLANGNENGKGSIVIVSGYRTIVCNYIESYKVVDWISFSASHSSGSTKVDTITDVEMCWDCDINDGGSPSECKTCNDTGKHMVTKFGMDEAVLLADNVKDYILKNLTKNFDF